MYKYSMFFWKKIARSLSPCSGYCIKLSAIRYNQYQEYIFTQVSRESLKKIKKKKNEGYAILPQYRQIFLQINMSCEFQLQQKVYIIQFHLCSSDFRSSFHYIVLISM